jgi:4-amino-4-deoxy-L-arabinose transferase-like glycosyltransferase
MKHTPIGVLTIILTGLFALAFFIFCFYSADQKSISNDEVAHIPAGYMIWKTGDYRLNPEHPSLVKMWAALPLLAFRFYVPLKDPDWLIGNEWHFGGYFLFNYNDADLIGIWSRFQIMILGVILGWIVYFWGRRLFVSGKGITAPVAGFFAAALYYTEPNLIAHSSLVTYDFALAFVVFCAAWCYWSMFVNGHNLKRIVIFIIFMSLAPMVKVVGFFLWFLVFAHLFFQAVLSKRKWKMIRKNGKVEILNGRGRKIVYSLSLVLLCCVVTYIGIWGIYRFRYSASPGLKIPPGDQGKKYLNFTPVANAGLRGMLQFVQRHRLAPQGYQAVIGHALLEKDRTAYLLGRSKMVGGYYSYFLVTTLLKTPFIHLFLILGSLLWLLWAQINIWRNRKRKGYKRLKFYIKRAAIPLYLIMGFFIIITLSQVNLGHRLILMIIPLECLIVGNILELILGKIKKGLRIPLQIVIPLLVLIAPVTSFPDYISYFNPIIGEQKRAFRYLKDSNVDWGQDIKPLGKYLGEKGIKKVNVSLFGTADPFYYGIKQWNDLGSFVILIPRYKNGEPDLTLPTVVSSNMIPYVAQRHPQLLVKGPPELIGGSIYIFPPYK